MIDHNFLLSIMVSGVFWAMGFGMLLVGFVDFIQAVVETIARITGRKAS